MTAHDRWLEAPYQAFYDEDDQPERPAPDEPDTYPEDLEHE